MTPSQQSGDVAATSRPLDLNLAQCATLACLWECLAPKPGNVYRGADFDDVTFAEFAASAVAIGSPLATAGQGVGNAALAAVRAMRGVSDSNTYLGTILLVAPLSAAAQRTGNLQTAVIAVLDELDEADAEVVYQAIREAQPGGLGTAATADVAKPPPPAMTLRQAMAFAAERDLVARQYAVNFADVFDVAETVEGGLRGGCTLADAIVRAHVQSLARRGDSLIARKCGRDVAAEAAARAGGALEAGEPGEAAYAAALAELDFWLRADGRRRNPGTTADLIAAGLFVLLVEGRIEWPVRFYG